ncbi:unnamed protein product [Anisakis simplex]|uniref:Nucleolar protein 6 n=1 Tax=Anisakis simplex TaxID=6269 RepID=A0A0M3JT04_ANISI|nr:unnamed protein product [Anisakis simplex]
MKRKLDAVDADIGRDEGAFDGADASNSKRETRRLLLMQIDDYCSEQQISSEHRKRNQLFADEIIDYLSYENSVVSTDQKHLPFSREFDLCDTSHLSTNGIQFPIRLPFGRQLDEIRSSNRCKWMNPEEIVILSEDSLRLTTVDDVALDLDVVIPLKYFGSRDFLNFAYHIKRAQYACCVCILLKKANRDYQFKFAFDEYDPYRPILLVTNDDQSVVRLHFSPADTFANPSRFRPDNNNLRSAFCFGHQAASVNHNRSDVEPPTPYYNASILSDLVRRKLDENFKKFLENKPNFVKAILMLRKWMQLRHFTTRHNGFNRNLITAWLIYLCEREGVLSKSSAVVDIIAAFFTSLATIDWETKCLYLAADVDNDIIDQFKKHYRYVFLDYSKYLNLAYSLSSVAWENIRDAAVRSLSNMESFNQFEILFNTEIPFQLSYDLYFSVHANKDFIMEQPRGFYMNELVRYCDDWFRITTERIYTLMKKAWVGRASLFDIRIQVTDCPFVDGTKKTYGDCPDSSVVERLSTGKSDEIDKDYLDAPKEVYSNFYIVLYGKMELSHLFQWKVSKSAPPLSSNDQAAHFILGVRLLPGWQNTVTRGPPAKSIDANEFRSFWGDVCELRKFVDNAICEAIVWNANASLSASVPFQICQHILSRHLKLKQVAFEERSVFDESSLMPSTEIAVNNRYEQILRCFDKLSQTLRTVKDLPLLITNINPVSSFLRGTSPFPPPIVDGIVDKNCAKLFMNNQVALPVRTTSPHFLPSIEVHLTMEQSGKWGENLEAIANLKTAFYNALCKILNEKFSCRSFAYESYALVVVDGVIFRLVISYPREVHIMRKNAAGGGIRLKDTLETKIREREVLLEPSLAANLHSLSQQFSAYAPACRIAFKWLASQMLSDHISDIIIETIMAHVFIYPLTDHQPRTSFVAFTHFLRLISSHNWLIRPLLVDFNKEWTEQDIDKIQEDFVKMRPVLPPMVICIPQDRVGCRWTRDEPHAVILKRIIALAKMALNIIEFNIGCKERIFLKCDTINTLPVCDYDPVAEYIRILKMNFATIALFFYDKYNGDRIAVIWKPDALQPKQSNISNSLLRYLTAESDILKLNKQAIIEDFIMDDLTAMLAESSVAPPNSTSCEHPRFSQYKNLMKAEASQEKRRAEYLRRQKEARFNYTNHARNLAMNKFDEEDEDDKEDWCKGDDDDQMSEDATAVKQSNREETPTKHHKLSARSRYANELMLSEWLVDIPTTLSTDWICLPCPVGRRALVVASNGVTSAYSKSGYLINQFSSYLPGGNRSSHTHYTLLDCVYSAKQSTFYCLDMITWKDSTVADSDFECRLFLLNSRISENENFNEISKQFPYRFVCLPSCRCHRSSIEQLMKSSTDFEFELDGVLFYYAGALYRPGQSPLVGWLKPWMLPEILSVSIPDALMSGNSSSKGTSQKFIDEFNTKHKHVSLTKHSQQALVDEAK